jgi:integrase/recombinase XerC
MEIGLTENRNLIFEKFNVFDFYLKNADLKEESRKRYKVGLYYFMNFLLDRNINSINEVAIEDIIDFKQKLYISNLKLGTKNLYISSVKSFYSWGYNVGIKNLAKNVKSFGTYTEFKKDGVTVDDYNKILENINKNTFFGKRNYLLIQMLFLNGIRQVSARKLKWSDFRIENLDDRATIIATIVLKGRGITEKDIAISEKTGKALLDFRAYLEDTHKNTFNDNWYVFGRNGKPLTDVGIRKVVRELLIKSNIHSKTITNHSLRHGIAKHLLKQTNNNIHLVAEHLGHTNTESTKFYINKEFKRQNMSNVKTNILDII